MKHQNHLFPFFLLISLLLPSGQTEASNPPLPTADTQRKNLPAAGFVQCTNIVDPSNGDTNVPVTTAINWEPAAGNPDAYILTVGTTPGGTDIVNQDVGNVTTFDPPGNLPSNTTIYVTVIGYNTNGPATGCMEESFTTAGASVPNCTNLTNPVHGATNVPVTASLNWAAATGNPTGYRLNVGTTPGGTNILNNYDAGNVTTYNPPGDFPYNATIYVKIIPYNATGNAVGCAEESFTTPVCTPNLLIVSNPVPAGTYRSSGDLTSHTSTVANGSTVVFTSDTGVLLDDNFVVELGAVFEAKILVCQ